MSRSSKSRPTSEASPVPRGEQRRLAIVATAEQVFLESGFAATTMQTVARAAAASKETLYRHFGSKEDLFAEVIGNRARLLREKLDADFDRPHAMAAVLRDLGINLLTHMSRTEVMRLLRIIIAEAPRDPMLGRIFLANGPERTRIRLAEYLAAARGRGEFHGDPELAAAIFLSAVIGSQHLLRLTISDPPPLSDAEIVVRVDEVVALFMARYGA